MKNFNIKINHSRELLRSIVLLAGYPIIYFLINLYLTYRQNFSYSVDSGYLLLTYLPLSNNSMFIWILILVCERIKSVRKLFSKENVNLCLILFDKFCCLMQCINKYFGLLLMLLVLESLFHFIIFFFSLYNLVANNSTAGDYLFSLMGLFYICWETAVVLCFFVYSYFIKFEIENFVSKFCTMQIDTKPIRNKLSTNLQFDHQEIELACGLFVINWKFLFAFISSIFSYIIILIQFDIADSFKYLEIKNHIKNSTAESQV